jgi:hypothetical protein
MNFEYFSYFLVTTTGAVLAIQDIRREKVDVRWLIGFAVSCASLYITKREVPCLIPFCIFIATGLLYYIAKKKHGLGMADYVVVFSESFLLNDNSWPLFIALCGFFGIVSYALLRPRHAPKTQGFPFIPSILVSALVVKSIMPS